MMMLGWSRLHAGSDPHAHSVHVRGGARHVDVSCGPDAARAGRVWVPLGLHGRGSAHSLGRVPKRSTSKRGTRASTSFGRPTRTGRSIRATS